MAIRILVVDDATFIRDMMKKNLRDRIPGAQILDANDGNRAIAVLKANPIDLIMSDWEMPGMSGEEFLRWVRSEDHYKSVPFVMVSSRGDRDHVVKAVEAGVSDYLTKPFTPDELVKKAVKQLKKVGKDPNVNFGSAAAANQGHAFGSIDALTGGAEKKVIQKAKKPIPKADNSALLGNTPPAIKSASTKTAPVKKAAPTQPNKPTNSGGGEPQAQLRFPNLTCACDVKDLSLQALNGTIKRGDEIPSLFDQAVVDIATGDGKDLARINGYVHSIQAAENRVTTEHIKIIVRFVDDDPQKFEVLSKFIAKRR
ncbi:response regulator [Aurantivibrio plasticivorans]